MREPISSETPAAFRKIPNRSACVKTSADKSGGQKGRGLGGKPAYRRQGSPPAKIWKGGEAAPLKTAKEPGEKHRLEPYFAKSPIRFDPQN